MNARRIRSGLFLLGLLVALGGTLSTHAFRMLQNNTVGRVTAGTRVACDAPGGFAHWALNNRNIPWQLNTANQGAGKEAAIRAAMNSWNAVFGTNYQLNLAGNNGGAFATDGVNTLRWATNEGCTGGCLGLTALVLQAGQIIVEADITFNNAETFRTNGNNNDTEAVAAHELGHALGIHHTEINGGNQTMQAAYMGSGGRSLETDDRAALQCSENRYGNPPPVPYITVSPNGGTAPLMVTFSGTQSTDANGTISQYQWQFSDGTTATGPTAVRTYYGVSGVNAVYGVTLTVTDNQGLARSTTSSVTVYCNDGQGGATCFYQNF